MRLFPVAAALILVTGAGAAAQSAGKLRDFSTDRPGSAHTAITVDAGHGQYEADLWNESYFRDGSRTTLFGNSDFKFGLTKWAELDAVVPLHETMQSGATGVGDLQLGGKLNFWGNDGGDSALGALLLVKLPTAASGLGNDMAEFTLNLPFTTTLPGQISATLEPALGLLREQNKQGYAGDYQLIGSLTRPVIGQAVAAGLSVAFDFSTDPHTGSRHTIGPSLQWLIGKNTQLDAGAYFGLTSRAVQYQPYVGVSFRL